MRLASRNPYSEYVPGLLLGPERRAATRARRRRLRSLAWSFLLLMTSAALVGIALNGAP